MKAPVHHTNNLHTHEKSDAPVRTIVVSLIGLAIGGFVVYLVVAGMWHYFTAKEEHPTATPYPYGRVPRELPPNPRLQVTPYLDWDRYRQEEMHRLSSYGWTDQGAGKVHIPIDRAMDIVAQRGLPTRTPGATQTPPRQGQRKEANEPVAH